MVIAAIILGCVSLIAIILGFSIDDEFFVIAGIIGGIFWIILFLLSLNIQISSQELTGYIYSASDTKGYTTAHIRFSQNAGTDSQPEFCVKTNSVAGRQIQKYVGSNTKVKVDIPSYFYFSNNPFACGTTNMTIKESK